ncbi:SDR family NAD(P)-dependent oxidoreductase [Hydrogenovibrio kuenenii]|uniref:SDR family NAD(P)-dependent oxidoreductase n=1 Tax=Hydrogenovibrio kuenenii TaxID=63658 RepID=UPI000463E161|nr:SDR family oxidoreductase [Hydrogenovibrio kuenenii]
MNVLITGGNGGIGSAIKEVFLDNQANIFSPSSKEVDLVSEDSIYRYLEKLPEIDVFIHCAGINEPVPFLSLVKDSLNDTLSVNVLSAVEISQYMLTKMKKRKFGRMVYVSSLWSTLGREGRSSYSMSKAALDALMRNIAVEFGKYDILINSVVPGFVDTPLTRKNLSQERINEITNNTPINKLVSAEEIAQITYFLCRKENQSITGQSIFVDGGYSILG